MMLGYLLARAGVATVVLEKHADFLRDFRGDTIHPATLALLDRLGLREALLALPHRRVYAVGGYVGDRRLKVAEYDHLGDGCNFLAYLPQWEFLNFVAERARALEGFELRMDSEAFDLLQRDGRVGGVRVRGAAQTYALDADLVIAADGRDSRLAALAGLPRQRLGAPMDVLWFHVPRAPDDPTQAFACVRDGILLAMIDRGSYWQCALNIRKDAYPTMRARDLGELRARLRAAAPFLGDRVEALRDWDDLKLLEVRVERLRRWYADGLLCIGDAAHAMSHVAGIGINLAIADAAAAARLLAPRLRAGRVRRCDLRAVQRRRMWPAVVAQGLQRTIARWAIVPILARDATPPVPLAARLLDRSRPLRRAAGSLIGLGVRPELPPADR